MRLGLCDVVQHFLRGACLARLLGSASAVEGDGLSLQREADLSPKLTERALSLAVYWQRELPLLTHLLKTTDGVLLWCHVVHIRHNKVQRSILVLSRILTRSQPTQYKYTTLWTADRVTVLMQLSWLGQISHCVCEQ